MTVKNKSWVNLRRVLSVTDVRQRNAEAQKKLPRSVSVRLEAKDSLPVFDLRSLPAIASVCAILLIIVYNLAGRWGIAEEAQVSVSWKQVVTERQIWRLFVAHYFHFSRVQFMVNVTSLMALGRYLEKKIRPLAMLLIILVMGLLSNAIHMILCSYICKDSVNHRTSGFSHVICALKMIQVLSKDAGKRRGPTLLLGIVPVYLGSFAPWEPLLEGVLSDVLVKGKHFATHVSGVIAGLSFPLLDYFWQEMILVPSPASISFSASSESQGALNRCHSISSSEEQLGRIMKVLREEESRVALFHELPSNDCVMLFYRHLPMKETSLHNQYSSKSDTYLLIKRKP